MVEAVACRGAREVTRWLVTGAGGMLGTDLMSALGQQQVTGLTRAELDVTDEPAVRAAVSECDIVINAAAWTDVDGAEANPDEAMAANASGPAVLARVCAASRARLIHVSTDYVFSGKASGPDADLAAAAPYAEDDPTQPETAYGRSKLAGEHAVLAAGGYVARTAWLYGRGGRNFVRTMLELEQSRDVLDVVDDQWGSPSWAAEVATRLVELGTAPAQPGVYHVTGAGRTTWCRFARAIFAEIGADPARVRATTSEAFKRPAPRPAFSVLGGARLVHAGITPMPEWHASLVAALPSVRSTVGGPA